MSGSKKCCAPNCDSSSEDNISLFRFPKDEPRCSLWKVLIANSQYDDYSATECYNRLRICSLHFPDEHFAGMLKSRLKKNAVPIFIDRSIKD